MKKKIFGLSILFCYCIMLSGCSAITEQGKYCFSAFSWVIDSVQQERKHDCAIMVRDADGEVLYESKSKEVMDYFSNLIERLDEEDLKLSCYEKVLYEYVMQDNDKRVSFYLYEPGNVLSCGVGRMRAYFNLSEEISEILMQPENWMLTE